MIDFREKLKTDERKPFLLRKNKVDKLGVIMKNFLATLLILISFSSLAGDRNGQYYSSFSGQQGASLQISESYMFLIIFSQGEEENWRGKNSWYIGGTHIEAEDTFFTINLHKPEGAKYCEGCEDNPYGHVDLHSAEIEFLPNNQFRMFEHRRGYWITYTKMTF